MKLQIKRLGIVGGISAGLTALSVGAAIAASTVVVTPTTQQGFSTADTRPGGNVSFVVDSTAPSGIGALNLTTDATNAAKAQYIHGANAPLADATDLSYYTKQNSASSPTGDPSYQVQVLLDGTAASFATLVYEPYWNGPVTPGVWQQWDVDSGQFWSSKTYTSGSCSVINGAGGPPLYSLATIKANCPNAVVVGFGVNIGTYNPSYDVEADLLKFNDTTYDFEPYVIASSKDQCKDIGWATVARADGSSFKNQGDCVSYTNGK